MFFRGVLSFRHGIFMLSGSFSPVLCKKRRAENLALLSALPESLPDIYVLSILL